MSILFYVLAFIACIATAAGGAWGMRWHIDRNEEIPDQEDPRDAQIRDLLAQTRMAKNDMLRKQQLADEATEHMQLAHERIDELVARIARLREQAESTASELAEARDDNERLREKLSVANRQADSLKQRNQELEVELSVSSHSDLLDPPGTQADDADELAAIESHDVDATAPSLLHSLSAELERWKRHCHVLGGELKLQRERLAQIGQTTDTDERPVDSIDELTDIRGIGNAIAKKLHQLGIYRYRELTSLTADDRERAQLLIPDFDRRMERDNWLEQARELHHDKYREPL